MNKISRYLEIIDWFRKSYYPASMAKKMNIRKQSLFPFTKELQKHGVVVKKSHFVWEVNEENVKPFIKHVQENQWAKQQQINTHHEENTIRGHAYKFVLKIPFILSIEQHAKVLDKNVKNHKVVMPSWIGHQFILNGWTVRQTPRTIMCWYPSNKSIYSTSAEEALLEAIYRWKNDVVHKIERWYKKKLCHKGVYEFKTSKAHHALIKNADAKRLHDEKKKLFVYDDGGVLRLLVDYSHNIDELEAVSAKHVDDATKMRKKYLSMLETDMTFHDVVNTFGMVAEQIASVTSNQSHFAKHLVSHVESVQVLGRAVNELASVVEELKPLNAETLIKEIHSWDDVKRLVPKINCLNSEQREQVGRHIIQILHSQQGSKDFQAEEKT